MTDGAPERLSGEARDDRVMDQERLDARLSRITRIPFRAKFHLRAPELAYVASRGPEIIAGQARELIGARLAPAYPSKDGRQTPWGGHPVFRAQHATATCCRKCLQINHGIPRGHELSERERTYILDVIRRWIEVECQAGSIPPPAPPPTLF